MPKANALVSLSVVSILCLTPITDYKEVTKVEIKKNNLFVKSKLTLLPIINWLGHVFFFFFPFCAE